MKVKYEINLYFLLWIGAVFYSIYAVYKVANDYFSSSVYDDTYDDFEPGWSLLGRKKDVSDYEWKYGLRLINSLIVWCCLHVVVTEFLWKCKLTQVLVYWYAAVSFLCVIYTLGFKTFIYFILQPIFGYLVLQFKSKRIIWFYYLLSLIVINYYKYMNAANALKYNDFISTTSIFWINLRCLNYCLEVTTNDSLRKFSTKNLVNAFAYCLYLPLLFTGPIVLFKDFHVALNCQEKRLLSTRLRELIINLMRYTFWLIFYEFSLHFVYVSALSYQPQVISSINSWALYGAGYCMGQFFQMKYVVIYGLSTTIAKFEDISVPKTPKCIGRIHLYSDMWKYFDSGLYLLLLRYIYIPLIGKKKNVFYKLLAGFMCFLFVYVWHGIQDFVAIWCLVNFIGVSIETISVTVSKTTTYINLTRNFSPQMLRRIYCFIATPLFAMSAISSFYFFAGKQVGDIYTRRFLGGPAYVTFNILICLYFGTQVSTELKLWDQKNIAKKEITSNYKGNKKFT